MGNRPYYAVERGGRTPMRHAGHSARHGVAELVLVQLFRSHACVRGWAGVLRNDAAQEHGEKILLTPRASSSLKSVTQLFLIRCSDEAAIRSENCYR